MEVRLFDADTIPEWAMPEWYLTRDRAPHLEEAPHVQRLELAARYVLEAVNAGAESVVDLGAGDGGLLSLLGPVPCWGYDLQPSNLQGARERGVAVGLADVLHDDIDWADVVVATEVIEHLVDPHGFVRLIAEHSRFLVASSPAFETAESHYAFHLWCWDMDGYRALIEQGGFMILRHELAGQFQVVLAERR